MAEYSHQNRITFKYGDRPLGRKELGDHLEFEFARCTRTPGTFKEECYDVARLIAEKAKRLNREIYILQSGGMDSEVVLKSFIDQEIPVKSIMFEYTGGLNNHEIVFADWFSKKHGVPILKHRIDPLSWIPKQQALFNDTFSASSFVLCHMPVISRVWDQLNGIPILGCGDVMFRKDDGEWFFYRQESTTLPWYWHMKNNGIDGVPGFFQWTPEIQLAMLLEPKMKEIGLNQNTLANKMLTSARLSKYMIYRRLWPDLLNRPKYTGQEFIYDFAADVQRAWSAEREVLFHDIWKTRYADIIEKLSQ